MKQAAAKDFYVYGDTIVAVMPQDERSRTLAFQKNSAWSHPLPAEVHAGPYLIRGNILEKGPKPGAFGRNSVLMRDLSIASVQRNGPWPGLEASCAFVGGQHKHFIAYHI